MLLPECSGIAAADPPGAMPQSRAIAAHAEHLR